jgi:hypothetical protein
VEWDTTFKSWGIVGDVLVFQGMPLKGILGPYLLLLPLSFASVYKARNLYFLIGYLLTKHPALCFREEYHRGKAPFSLHHKREKCCITIQIQLISNFDPLVKVVFQVNANIDNLNIKLSM